MIKIMKKILKLLLVVLMVLSTISCDAYAQAYYVEERPVVYEYSYNNFPVRYVNGIAYYYCFFDNIWNWYVLPRAYYPYISHHRPLRYVHHRNVYNRPNIVHHHQRRYSHNNRSYYNQRFYNNNNRNMHGSRNNMHAGRR